jgi:hypothetical protein
MPSYNQRLSVHASRHAPPGAAARGAGPWAAAAFAAVLLLPLAQAVPRGLAVPSLSLAAVDSRASLASHAGFVLQAGPTMLMASSSDGPAYLFQDAASAWGCAFCGRAAGAGLGAAVLLKSLASSLLATLAARTKGVHGAGKSAAAGGHAGMRHEPCW